MVSCVYKKGFFLNNAGISLFCFLVVSKKTAGILDTALLGKNDIFNNTVIIAKARISAES